MPLLFKRCWDGQCMNNHEVMMTLLWHSCLCGKVNCSKRFCMLHQLLWVLMRYKPIVFTMFNSNWHLSENHGWIKTYAIIKTNLIWLVPVKMWFYSEKSAWGQPTWSSHLIIQQHKLRHRLRNWHQEPGLEWPKHEVCVCMCVSSWQVKHAICKTCSVSQSQGQQFQLRTQTSCQTVWSLPSHTLDYRQQHNVTNCDDPFLTTRHDKKRLTLTLYMLIQSQT